jgi:hypothetical protein
MALTAPDDLDRVPRHADQAACSKCWKVIHAGGSIADCISRGYESLGRMRSGVALCLGAVAFRTSGWCRRRPEWHHRPLPDRRHLAKGGVI